MEKYSLVSEADKENKYPPNKHLKERGKSCKLTCPHMYNLLDITTNQHY